MSIMKKIGTITLHASYNFGSVLQAYALQEFVKQLDNDIDYEIINLRTQTQKNMYLSFFEQENLPLKSKIYKFLLRKYREDYTTRQLRYENFINKYLNITKEFSSMNEIQNHANNYDFYIAGSDQIWNYNALLEDFDWSYLLSFTNSKNKISYSASMGPIKQNENKKLRSKFISELEKFKYVSVRDQATKAYIEKFSDIRPQVHIDPTMLLTKKEWENLCSPKKRIIQDEYILLYQFWNIESIKIAKKLSKLLNLKVVVPKFPLKQEWYNGFKCLFDVGPKEFLNLVSNAKYIVGSSFHACVFSIIFEKEFFAVNAKNDFRIQTLLDTFNLHHCTIEEKDINKQYDFKYKIDYNKVNKILNKKRKESEKYLRNAMELNNN